MTTGDGQGDDELAAKPAALRQRIRMLH